MLLGKKLCDSKISIAENPKTIWEFGPVFMKQKLNNFCTKFNRLKTEEDQNEGIFIHLFFNVFCDNAYGKDSNVTNFLLFL